MNQSSCMMRTLSTFPALEIYRTCIADSHLQIGRLRLIIYSGAYIFPFFIIGFISPSRTPIQGFIDPTWQKELVEGWKIYIYGVTARSVDFFWFFRFSIYFLPPKSNISLSLIWMQENPVAKLKGLHKKFVNITYFHWFEEISYYSMFVLPADGIPKQ